MARCPADSAVLRAPQSMTCRAGSGATAMAARARAPPRGRALALALAAVLALAAAGAGGDGARRTPAAGASDKLQSRRSGPPRLAAALPSGLGPGELATLRGLRELVIDSKYADQFVKNRTFGVNGTGQETVFLQEKLDGVLPALRAKLRALADQLDRQEGWGVLGASLSGRALTMRCVELLRYNGGSSGTEGVGWHSVRSHYHPCRRCAVFLQPLYLSHTPALSILSRSPRLLQDGTTLMTMVIMLSAPEEFVGGAVEFRRSSGARAVTDERYMLRPGEALGWKGWTSHRVAPVTDGVREVFVVEWWIGAECAVTLDPRGSDTRDMITHTLKLDPGSGFLHRLQGEELCEQLPCDDECGGTVAAEAEAAYRMAAQLTPEDPATIHSLGYFLLGSDMHGRRAEGVALIRNSHVLDPSVIAPVPVALLALEEPPWLCRQDMWPVLCERMPVVMVEKLERLLYAGAALAVIGPLYFVANASPLEPLGRRVSMLRAAPKHE